MIRVAARSAVAIAAALAVAAGLVPASAEDGEAVYLGTGDDFAQISQLFARYNAGVDDGDAEVWSSTFTENGVFNGEDGCVVGRAALAQVVERRNEQIRASADQPDRRHVASPGVIEYSDANHATVRSMVMVIADRHGETPPAILRTGAYFDRLERVGGKWLFAQRGVVPHGEEAPAPCETAE